MMHTLEVDDFKCRLSVVVYAFFTAVLIELRAIVYIAIRPKQCYPL